jgi:hypothetical protein
VVVRVNSTGVPSPSKLISVIDGVKVYKIPAAFCEITITTGSAFPAVTVSESVRGLSLTVFTKTEIVASLVLPEVAERPIQSAPEFSMDHEPASVVILKDEVPPVASKTIFVTLTLSEFSSSLPHPIRVVRLMEKKITRDSFRFIFL